MTDDRQDDASYDRYLPRFLRSDAIATPEAREPRPPRRLARRVSIDARIEALMGERLERIDRATALPAETVAAVNALIAEGGFVLARAPAELRAAPLDASRPVAPGAAFVALLKLRMALVPPGG